MTRSFGKRMQPVRNPDRRAIHFPALILAILVIILGCGRKAPERDAVSVVVSIQPYASLAKQILPENAVVEVIVKPGSDPHMFQLSPGDVAAITKADIVFINGGGLEPFGERVSMLAHDTGIPLVEVDAIAGDDEHNHSASTGDNSHSMDVHYWLQPALMVPVVEELSKNLAELNPDWKSKVQARTATLINELRELDSEIRSTLGEHADKTIVLTHVGWNGFFEHYGFTDIMVLEEMPGEEISAKRMTEVMESIEKHAVKTVFAQRQTASAIGASVAESSGCEVLYLDPLGDGNTGYFELMRMNAQTINQGLQ